MRAGLLDHRITVESFTTVRDTYGDPIKTWATYVQRWARVEQTTGNERFQSQRWEAETSHVFHIRYDATTGAIDPTMRVLYDSKYFNIQEVREVMAAAREVLLLCTERVGED